MLASLPDFQKERGFPCTLSRKKNLLKFKRESTRFEGSPVQGIDAIPHLAGAFKDLVDGSAAAHRAVVLP